nr:PREDICTED: uncharacterized protein LOC105675664 [Linepithema humile]
MSVATSTLYMFLANHAAQAVTDHNNHVFVTAYNIQWYITPLYIQKMILFLLQKGTKDFTLTIGGIFVGSLECFATMKDLLMQLQHTYDKLKDENEYAIVEKYSYNAKYYTVILTRL